jgi:hypothetical protein
MKSLYAAASFPDIYFIIGAFTSGGTVTNRGLLLGVNQASNDSKVPLNELSSRQRTRVNDIKVLPNLLGHELIHFQQGGMKGDTTTLSYAIKEGMADFIGELISGNTANPVLFSWAKGKEKQIWSKFTKDMYYDRYSNWIANSQQATADNPPDQGYWIGYQIVNRTTSRVRIKSRQSGTCSTFKIIKLSSLKANGKIKLPLFRGNPIFPNNKNALFLVTKSPLVNYGA